MLRFSAALIFAVAASAGAGIVIYGGTPAGLAAAAAAVRQGASVVVVEPSTYIGGMITGGIASTDTGTPHLVGGIAREFFEEVAAENRRLYPKAETPRLAFRGQLMEWRKPRPWDLEPKVARSIFERWVRDGGYQLILNQRVAQVKKRGARIQSIRLTNGAVLAARYFIDASYEGDVMARAGVSYTWGRESTAAYGEKLAGVRAPHFRANYPAGYYQKPGTEYTHHGQFGADIRPRDDKGQLLWGVDPAPRAPIGSADRRVQAYCFRLIATQREDLRVPWPRPARYEPHRYELLLRYVLAHPGISFARLVHFGAIPNGKFDLNASGPFSIDYVGGNLAYPDGDYATRDRIYSDHENYEKGFFWFLAHDPRVPAELREEVNSWGLCKDEYPETGHWPRQLYIREARRMIGAYVMTERDILEDKRKADSVGMGSFVLDSHWVQRYENAGGFARVEGHLDESISLADYPYDIPYRSLTPKRSECENLLVPVCLSATHVAICTIRMEPVYMMMGHAAGAAAAQLLKKEQRKHESPERTLSPRAAVVRR